MDPLSITTSVITLLGAGSNVYDFLQSIRHADRGLQSLVREVNTLNGFLRSIEKALEDCRDNPYALAHIDPALWKESKVALSDCQETLDQLGSVFKEPKRPSRSNSLFRRARVAAELRSRAGDIASFREKIFMSNLSLQTLLQVINVSLSLRGNESHDNILRDLKELKDALKKSSQAATVSYSTLFLNEQDTRLVHHLKGLVRAAQEFHTSASTTASTVAGSGETHPPPTDFGDDESKSGVPYRLPSMKRQQIETYLSHHQQAARAGTSTSSRKADELVSPDSPKGSGVILEAREIGPDHVISNIFTRGISKIAQQTLQQLDLQRAEDLLIEALKWYGSSGSDDTRHQRHLQTQLALCNLLQGNRQEAQDLILLLVDSNLEQDVVAHQLLYALTLLQLHELDFERAKENSKRLWDALQRTTDCRVLDSNHAMRLLATSYQKSGDSLLAAAIEAELPDLRLSDPVPKMVDFLVDSEGLLTSIFGFQGHPGVSNPLSVVTKIHNLPIAKKPSSLQIREQLQEDVYSAISGCPPDCVDHGLLEGVDQEFPISQPKMKRKSWLNIRAFFRPLLSRHTGSSVDLHSSHTGTPDPRSKLRKRVKTTHVGSATSPMGTDPHHSAFPISVAQKPIRTEQAVSIGGNSGVQSVYEPQTADRTTGHSGNNPADATTGHHSAREPEQPLQRWFSFHAGVPDCVSKKPLATLPATSFEMQNGVIFELMDTSPNVKQRPRESQPNGKRRPRHLLDISRLHRFDENNSPPSCLPGSSVQIPDVYSHSSLFEQARRSHNEVDMMDMTTTTSLEMENDIYQLLGYDRHPTETVTKQTPAKLNRSPSSASGGFLARLNVTTESSSGSDSDTFSDFDCVTQSTRQTSFNYSLVSDEESGDNDGVNRGSPAASVVRTKDQQATGLGPGGVSPTRRPSNATSDNIQVVEPGNDPSPARSRKLGYGTANGASSAQFPGPRARSRQEFGPAVARLCRYRSPGKAVFRRRLPGSTAAGLRRLFHGQDGQEGFSPNPNNALYFGPNAVVGPFTDLDENNEYVDTRQATFMFRGANHGNVSGGETQALGVGV
ncbi:hypothetical protein SAMD00023353_1100370 [Rosellinia necatrix]|uniref:Fungal N-terminal domain-containing protein n=1 Tax=Rosellinia necatrix TaxID=77044 RepID=A0A1S7UMD6_ROSNE|nr:hypothetical protein SAMD00023353_1100370 [Rosellinia necatrix]